MSVLDISAELAGEGQTVATGRRCKFGQLLDALPADQAAELTNRLNGEWSAERLAKLISGTAFGYIGSTTVGRHHRHSCPCDTPTESQAA